MFSKHYMPVPLEKAIDMIHSRGMSTCAPIVLFVYNRPTHTQQTLAALVANRLAEESSLFIFSDGAKSGQDLEKVDDVRKVVRSAAGFRSVKVIESEVNQGLANSVIAGVSQVIEEFGSAIVVEDDLITSPQFLEFMNACLKTYQDDSQIWSISGFTPRIHIPKSYKHDVYLVPRAWSWGWATWRDRWQLADWEVKDYIAFLRSPERKRKFNLAGNDMTIMLADQMAGRSDSWLIRWCYTAFLLGRYTVYPTKSRVRNIGFDHSGTHGSIFARSKFAVELSDEPIRPVKNLQPSHEIIEALRHFHNKSWFRRLLGPPLRRIGLLK